MDFTAALVSYLFSWFSSQESAIELWWEMQSIQVLFVLLITTKVAPCKTCRESDFAHCVHLFPRLPSLSLAGKSLLWFSLCQGRKMLTLGWLWEGRCHLLHQGEQQGWGKDRFFSRLCWLCDLSLGWQALRWTLCPFCGTKLLLCAYNFEVCRSSQIKA